MTGGDTISARFLYQEHFEFRPSFKLWLSTNKLPMIKGTDDGIWRRVRVIPFDVSIPPEQQDRDLVEKLKGEASGILNFMLEGSKNWRAGGLQPPWRVSVATKQYRTDMDVLGQFFDDCCVFEEQAQVSVKDLREAYQRHCEDIGETPLSPSVFGQLLKDRGFKQARTKKVRFWAGLRLARLDDDFLE